MDKTNLIITLIAATDKIVWFYCTDNHNPYTGLVCWHMEPRQTACESIEKYYPVQAICMVEPIPGLYQIEFEEKCTSIQLTESALKELNISSIEFK